MFTRTSAPTSYLRRVRATPVDTDEDAVALEPRQPALEEHVRWDLVELELAIGVDSADHSFCA